MANSGRKPPTCDGHRKLVFSIFLTASLSRDRSIAMKEASRRFALGSSETDIVSMAKRSQGRVVGGGSHGIDVSMERALLPRPSGRPGPVLVDIPDGRAELTEIEFPAPRGGPLRPAKARRHA